MSRQFVHLTPNKEIIYELTKEVIVPQLELTWQEVMKIADQIEKVYQYGMLNKTSDIDIVKITEELVQGSWCYKLSINSVPQLRNQHLSFKRVISFMTMYWCSNVKENHQQVKIIYDIDPRLAEEMDKLIKDALKKHNSGLWKDPHWVNIFKNRGGKNE